MYVTLTGGFGGFAFTQVQVYSSFSFWGNTYFLIPDAGYSMLVAGTTYTTFTTISTYASQILAWQTFVTGVPDYTTAGDLWTTGRDAYLITKTINTLRMDLPWFSSKADWGGNQIDDGAITLIGKVIGWLSKPNKRTGFKLPITATNLALEVGTGFKFKNAVLTSGISFYAWFENLTLNTDESCIEADFIFFPWTVA